VQSIAAAALVLAKISKHDIGGIVAVVVGLAIVGFGVMRVMARVAGAAVIPVIGVVVIVIGILLFARAF